MYEEKLSQEERVLNILKHRKWWVPGVEFLHLDKPIMQYHARIWGLQKKGYRIEGRFVEGQNYKEYRLYDNKVFSPNLFNFAKSNVH